MPTNNHNFSQPTEGQTPWTQDWHDNFESLDTLLQGMSADGTSLSGLSSIDTDEAHIGAANGSDGTYRVNPFLDAVLNGYVVGSSPNYLTIADPADYATAADTLQAVHDDLEANAPETSGFVHFGPTEPDGTQRTISKTVHFGPNGDPILPKGHGFHSSVMSCTINDGSPMFEIGTFNSAISSSTAPFGGFAATGNNNDCEAIRLKQVVHWRMEEVALDYFANGTASEGYIVIDSGCFTWEIDDFTQVAGQPGADIVVLVDNSTTLDWPGNGVFCEGFEVNGTCNAAVRSKCMNPPVKFEGYIEDSEGPAKLYWGPGSGSLIITPESTFGGGSPNADSDHVYFEGKKLLAYPGFVINANRHAFNIGPEAEQFRIHSYNRLGSNGGDDINISSGAGKSASPSNIPFESQMPGTITAPVGREIVYPNGASLIKEYTAQTVPAGGTLDLGTGTATSQRGIIVDWAFNADPTADALVNYAGVMFDSSSGLTNVRFEETLGTTSADIDVKVYHIHEDTF